MKTIKIGMDVLTHKEMTRELGAAAGRGVAVRLFVDLKKACDGSLECIKQLLLTGVQVCHCTEKIGWKAAIFDGQILVQGSQSWTESDLQGSNMEYSIVHTGPIGENLVNLRPGYFP